MRVGLCTVMLSTFVSFAEAAPNKNWYLRIDNGAGGEAFVFKSKAACEAAGQRYLRLQREFDSKPQKYESKRRWSKPRCLNRLPYGYLPPP